MRLIFFIFPLVLLIQMLSSGQLDKQKQKVKSFALPEVKYERFTPTIPTIKEGFVCRAEDAVNQGSKIAVTFRLGNLQYVNQLERQ